MATISAFGNTMVHLSRTIQENADKKVRMCALAMDTALVMATPVDTGKARSNWQVSIGQPEYGVREAYVPGKGQSTIGVCTQAALDHGKAIIMQYNSNTQSKEIWISNPVPYIGKLNNGHSAQAPSGFVEKAIMVGINAIATSGNILGNR